MDVRKELFAPRSRLLLLVCLTVLAGLAGMYIRATSNPDVIYLKPENGARWIRSLRPFSLRSQRNQTATTEYRTNFVLEQVPDDVTLTLHALKQADLFLDDKPIRIPQHVPENWKQPVTISLSSHLTPGPHTLRIVVTNQNGPALLLAHSQSLNLVTGPDWEAREPESPWTHALPVDQPRPPPELVNHFTTSTQALREQTPLLLLVFSLVFFGTVFQARNSRVLPAWQLRYREILNLNAVRFSLMGLWILLAINSLLKVPTQGFDYPAHLEYISYMTEHHIPPLATEGWQMFQTPLYYMLSAGLYKVLVLFCEPETSQRLLRIIPLLCGLLQIELCFRALKITFPDKKHLQGLGMLLGGLLPMNLYMSQNIGNEPLAGLLSAVVVVMGLRCLHNPAYAQSQRTQWILGIVLGLAILTKVTAILLLLPILVVLYLSLKKNAPATLLPGGLKVLAGPVILSGWYFLRNWLTLGKPYIGGWDPSREIVWWQDPGFRILEHITTFGESLFQPIYAARHGFWDAVYSSFWLDGFLSGVAQYEARPPWNESYMLCAPWLALLPTIAILWGGINAFRNPQHPVSKAILFCLGCIGIYFAAMLGLFLDLPIYSTAKATYTLGLIPCYALLGAAGLECVTRHTVLRAATYGIIACWGLFSYLAYFAL